MSACITSLFHIINYLQTGKSACTHLENVRPATADQGTGFQSRVATGGQTSYVPGPFWTAPVWLKLKRQSDTVTASVSLDGTSWTTITTRTVPIIEPMLFGLAVTSHNGSELNTTTFDNVTWTPMP